MALGVAVASASVPVVIAVAAYFAILYPPVIREESAFLAARFPGPYAAWARDVPVFLPRLRPAGPRESRFGWARVRANREWRTAAALPADGRPAAGARALVTRRYHWRHGTRKDLPP